MNESLVLVDTSAWIDYLQGVSSELVSLLHYLLEEDRVTTTPVVRLELLTGAKDQSQYEKLEDFLGGLRTLPLTEKVFSQAERMRFELRMNEGVTIPVAVIFIASSALNFECSLLHFDRHFDRIKSHNEALMLKELDG